MKHFRILEIKKNNKKFYIIQYLKDIIFRLNYWKKLNDKTYFKYEDALGDIKKILKKEDYDNSNFGYHYIDAYKIFKYKDKDVIQETEIKKEIKKEQHQRKINKSIYIPNKK